MAYVGTASNLGNDQDTLRSVVLGEAGNQGYAGQLAVADVIQNRANANASGAGGFSGGTTMVGVATAPNQFQGQADLSQYSPEQIATADKAIAAAQGGTDITGGATYYANPGASSAAWAKGLNSDNSLQIGDHYFTNNTNGTAFQPTGNVGAAAAGDGSSDDGTTARPLTIHRADYTATSAGDGAGGSADSTTATGSATGDLSAAGSVAGAAGALASLTGSNTNGSAAGIVANAENWTGDLFVRAIVILLGLVLVVFGLYYFKGGGNVTINSIARTVKKHPLLAAA